MNTQLNSPWLRGFVLVAIICCTVAEPVDAASRRHFRGRSCRPSYGQVQTRSYGRSCGRRGPAGIGEAVGEAMGTAIADSLLTVLTLGTYDPRHPSGQVKKLDPPKAPAKVEPKPKERSCDAKWTHAWKAATLVGKGLYGDAERTELTSEAIGLAFDILQGEPSEGE